MNYQCKSAVLLVCFNRPEHTKKVLNQIRLVRPSKLYWAIDGPRFGRPDDVVKINQVKEVLSGVDWECKVEKLTRISNLGCKDGVKSAIDWFFDYETEGIILEDDIYPLVSFFKFCDEMLFKYRENSEVCVVGGSNSIANLYKPKTRYFYSIYNHCWGWATWKRSWVNYEKDLGELQKKINPLFLKKIGGGWCFSIIWTAIFKNVVQCKVNSWAYIWTFSCWARKKISVLPASPLTINIGYDDKATHTTSESPLFLRNTNLVEMDFCLNDPKIFQRDIKADRLIGKVIFDISIYGAFKAAVKLIPGFQFILNKIRN